METEGDWDDDDDDDGFNMLLAEIDQGATSSPPLSSYIDTDGPSTSRMTEGFLEAQEHVHFQREIEREQWTVVQSSQQLDQTAELLRKIQELQKSCNEWKSNSFAKEGEVATLRRKLTLEKAEKANLINQKLLNTQTQSIREADEIFQLRRELDRVTSELKLSRCDLQRLEDRNKRLSTSLSTSKLELETTLLVSHNNQTNSTSSAPQPHSSNKNITLEANNYLKHIDPETSPHTAALLAQTLPKVVKKSKDVQTQYFPSDYTKIKELVKKFASMEFQLLSPLLDKTSKKVLQNVLKKDIEREESKLSRTLKARGFSATEYMLEYMIEKSTKNGEFLADRISPAQYRYLYRHKFGIGANRTPSSSEERNEGSSERTIANLGKEEESEILSNMMDCGEAPKRFIDELLIVETDDPPPPNPRHPDEPERSELSDDEYSYKPVLDPCVEKSRLLAALDIEEEEHVDEWPEKSGEIESLIESTQYEIERLLHSHPTYYESEIGEMRADLRLLRQGIKPPRSRPRKLKEMRMERKVKNMRLHGFLLKSGEPLDIVSSNLELCFEQSMWKGLEFIKKEMLILLNNCEKESTRLFDSNRFTTFVKLLCWAKHIWNCIRFEKSQPLIYNELSTVWESAFREWSTFLINLVWRDFKDLYESMREIRLLFLETFLSILEQGYFEESEESLDRIYVILRDTMTNPVYFANRKISTILNILKLLFNYKAIPLYLCSKTIDNKFNKESCFLETVGKVVHKEFDENPSLSCKEDLFRSFISFIRDLNSVNVDRATLSQVQTMSKSFSSSTIDITLKTNSKKLKLNDGSSVTTTNSTSYKLKHSFGDETNKNSDESDSDDDIFSSKSNGTKNEIDIQLNFFNCKHWEVSRGKSKFCLCRPNVINHALCMLKEIWQLWQNRNLELLLHGDPFPRNISYEEYLGRNEPFNEIKKSTLVLGFELITYVFWSSDNIAGAFGREGFENFWHIVGSYKRFEKFLNLHTESQDLLTRISYDNEDENYSSESDDGSQMSSSSLKENNPPKKCKCKTGRRKKVGFKCKPLDAKLEFLYSRFPKLRLEPRYKVNSKS